MPENFLEKLFSLQGKVAVVTGGSGALGGAMAQGLVNAGAKVAIIGRDRERAEARANAFSAGGGEAIALVADVSNTEQLETAKNSLLEKWGKVDILVNAAGGNIPAATIADDSSFFAMAPEAFQQVMDLNLTGTLLPSQIFGRAMVEQKQNEKPQGVIINVSSMAAIRAMTRVVGYGAAKAAVDNLTRWLALELGRKYGAGLRVNAIAPGFFIGEQNRRLLLNPDGSLTARGQKVIDHTPAGRFGEAEELVSTLIWLCSPGANFVTGVVVPVDGGFSIFSGV
ncbi:MAG TPA: SDR family oxidoreductase [Chloroflexia bacterium]|nr:SDR family oxidoreductase [Chloroflexia bacterium]